MDLEEEYRQLGERLAPHLRPRRVCAALHLLRAITARVVVPGDANRTLAHVWRQVVQDADLIRAFHEDASGRTPAAVHTRRSLLKVVLLALLWPDADARRRWPLFWTDGRVARHTTRGDAAVLDKVLPYAVWRAGPGSPYWRLFERLARQIRIQSQMHRPTSMRKGLAFLYGFLSTTVTTNASTTAEGVLERLRAQTPTSLREAYLRYRRDTCQGRPLTLPALARHVHFLALVFHRILGVCPGGTLTLESLFGLPDPGRRGGGGRRRRMVVDVPPPPPPMLDDNDLLSPACADAEGLSLCIQPPATRADKVHTFSAAEVRALYLACGPLFEKVLLTALFTTGMRINGFCSLEWPASASSAAPLLEVFGTEKGNVRMSFGVSPVLQGLLREWMSAPPDGGSRRYLFPSRDHPDIHISTSTVRRAFRGIADRAGVQGPHVHPHTTRHTVAWTLPVGHHTPVRGGVWWATQAWALGNSVPHGTNTLAWWCHAPRRAWRASSATATPR